MARRRLTTLVLSLALVVPALVVGGGSALVALPAAVDTDGDGFIDTVEDNLGSDSANAASTPESGAVLESCIDGLDDDFDGTVDDADSGCQPPHLSKRVFPPTGSDSFDSTMTLDGYTMATPLGICPLDFEGSGPTVVRRGNPVDLGGGLRRVATEIVALQLSGTGTLLPGSPCNPGATSSSFPATIIEDPMKRSTGKIDDTNADPAKDFPANSFFDVFFEIDTPLGLLPGGPPGGPAGTPVRVTNTINSIPPVYSPANPSLNPSCYAVAGLPHQHCPKPPLDHFKCYAGKFPAFEPRKVGLHDQFGRGRVKVTRPGRFCNPVSKNGLNIFDPAGHLKRYRIEPLPGQPAFVPLDVLVHNQFGAQNLSVKAPLALFVPSKLRHQTKPAALDHFKCYSVSGQAVNQKVKLKDQFDVQEARVERAMVGRPVTLCNPTTKTVDGLTTPVGNPEWHLVCYAIDTQKFKPRRVVVINQFGKEVVTVVAPVQLCVPSLKLVLPPVEVDQFPGSTAVIQLQHDIVMDSVTLAGPSTVEVDLAGLGDTDADGREQVSTEIVQMQLTGNSSNFGTVSLTIRDPVQHPTQASVGEIEETTNTSPGVLDVPPFTAAGTAQSFFDVFFEVTFSVNNQPVTLHTCNPTRITTTITHKPPAPGETYNGPQVMQLCDEQEQPVPASLGPLTFVPIPA